MLANVTYPHGSVMWRRGVGKTGLLVLTRRTDTLADDQRRLGRDIVRQSGVAHRWHLNVNVDAVK